MLSPRRREEGPLGSSELNGPPPRRRRNAIRSPTPVPRVQRPWESLVEELERGQEIKWEASPSPRLRARPEPPSALQLPRIPEPLSTTARATSPSTRPRVCPSTAALPRPLNNPQNGYQRAPLPAADTALPLVNTALPSFRQQHDWQPSRVPPRALGAATGDQEMPRQSPVRDASDRGELTEEQRRERRLGKQPERHRALTGGTTYQQRLGGSRDPPIASARTARGGAHNAGCPSVRGARLETDLELASCLPPNFPPFRRTEDWREIAQFQANARHYLALSGPPATDVQYTIIAVKTGDEHLLLGEQPRDVMTEDFMAEVREHHVEAPPRSDGDSQWRFDPRVGFSHAAADSDSVGDSIRAVSWAVYERETQRLEGEVARRKANMERHLREEEDARRRAALSRRGSAADGEDLALRRAREMPSRTHEGGWESGDEESSGEERRREERRREERRLEERRREETRRQEREREERDRREYARQMALQFELDHQACVLSREGYLPPIAGVTGRRGITLESLRGPAGRALVRSANSRSIRESQRTMSDDRALRAHGLAPRRDNRSAQRRRRISSTPPVEPNPTPEPSPNPIPDAVFRSPSFSTGQHNITTRPRARPTINPSSSADPPYISVSSVAPVASVQRVRTEATDTLNASLRDNVPPGDPPNEAVNIHGSALANPPRIIPTDAGPDPVRNLNIDRGEGVRTSRTPIASTRQSEPVSRRLRSSTAVSIASRLRSRTTAARNSRTHTQRGRQSTNNPRSDSQGPGGPRAAGGRSASTRWTGQLTRVEDDDDAKTEDEIIVVLSPPRDASPRPMRSETTLGGRRRTREEAESTDSEGQSSQHEKRRKMSTIPQRAVPAQ